MTPLYFGDSARQLFGIYQAPATRPRDTGVLLCNPVGKEYMRSHWALRQVASQLTRSGFHVFRFDYRGTGDSAGESGEGDVASWCEDVVAAAEELKDMAGTRRLALVGLRLGAALAALASETLRPLRLVLWDPVVAGKPYLDEIGALHRELLASRTYFARPRADAAPDELLGFRCPRALRASIATIDLPRCLAHAERIHLVVSERRDVYERLQQTWSEAHGARFSHHTINAPGEWGDLEQIEHALLVGDLPRTLAELLERAP